MFIVQQYGKEELWHELSKLGLIKLSYRSFRRWLYSGVFEPSEYPDVKRKKWLRPGQVKKILEELGLEAGEHFKFAFE